MRWKTETLSEKRKRLEQWRTWFAWYPVKMNGEWVWFEQIYRRTIIYSGPGTDVYETEYCDTLGLLKKEQAMKDYDGLE